MNHSNGNGTERPAELTSTRPLVLLRARPGTAPETARVVHLAPLPPSGTGAVSALCGTLLRPEEHETVTPGRGMPCSLCLISHAFRIDSSSRATDDIETITATATASTPDPTSPGITPSAAALTYQSWGWPVTLRRDQVWLTLDTNAVAVLMSRQRAAEATAILARRHCSPAVLIHPNAPEHRVVLCGERFGVGLPWPKGVHPIADTLLLPPTTTPHGPLTWVHPPGRDALRRCREIDLIAAVQATLHDPPAASGPVQC